MRLTTVVLCLQCLFGCAFGTTVDFRRQTIGLAAYSAAEMPGSFRLGVLDARGEAEARVGTSHALLPVPWPVMTESAKTLADDTTVAILSGFERTKLPAHRVIIPASNSVAEARRAVRPDRGDVGFLFTIREFWVRTWLATSFTYDVLLEVLDADGAIVASAEAKDVEPVGDYDAPQLAGPVFTRLLTASQIRSATKRLTQRSPGAAAAPMQLPAEAPAAREAPPITPGPVKRQSGAPPKCSVEQVLKMKAMALTDEQIRAACPE
jgi:hypothetical protein